MSLLPAVSSFLPVSVVVPYHEHAIPVLGGLEGHNLVLPVSVLHRMNYFDILRLFCSQARLLPVDSLCLHIYKYTHDHF